MSEQAEPRPTFHSDERALSEAREAVELFVAELQAGWDAHSADVTDRHLAADLLWGSPFGATVRGYDRLHAIHVELKAQNQGGASSRFEVEQLLVPMPGVALTQIRRQALGLNGEPLEPRSDLSGAFSELTLYVLVLREGTWWVAAGHNTPIRSGGAA